MLITSCEAVSRTRTRVTIDDDRTLVLANKEMTALSLQQGSEMDSATYEEILKEQRSAALVRAGNLLKGMDYTEKGLRDKLVRAGYPEEVAQEVTASLVDAHYVDDRRYAQNYLQFHLEDRSLARIRAELQGKGIPREVLSEILSSYEEENPETAARKEQEQILRFLRKRHYSKAEMEPADVLRIKASLLRKGYTMDNIRRAMDAIN